MNCEIHAYIYVWLKILLRSLNTLSINFFYFLSVLGLALCQTNWNFIIENSFTTWNLIQWMYTFVFSSPNDFVENIRAKWNWGTQPRKIKGLNTQSHIPSSSNSWQSSRDLRWACLCECHVLNWLANNKCEQCMWCIYACDSQ